MPLKHCSDPLGTQLGGITLQRASQVPLLGGSQPSPLLD